MSSVENLDPAILHWLPDHSDDIAVNHERSAHVDKQDNQRLPHSQFAHVFNTYFPPVHIRLDKIHAGSIVHHQPPQPPQPQLDIVSLILVK
ncbi:MAG: hypothetical protein WCL02_08225 [bacterium]